MPRRVIVLLAGLLAQAGCPSPGSGQGWVGGSLWLENCDSGEDLARHDDFDLRADFFFGDPLFDTTSSAAERRNSLFVRIQETASNIEEANGLSMQFHDLTVAAQAFARSEALPITDKSICRTCTDLDTAVRMALNLFVRCPSNRSPMSALALALEAREPQSLVREQECLLPRESQPSACPELTPTQVAELQRLCDEADFNDRANAAAIKQLLGDEGACLFLCRLGSATRGADPLSLQGFEVDYGERIAGVFSTNVVDTRAVRLEQCAGAYGHLTGMFSFDLVRSRVAQPFP